MDNGDKVFKLIQAALARIEGKVDRLASLPAKVKWQARLIGWLYALLFTVTAGLVVAFARGN